MSLVRCRCFLAGVVCLALFASARAQEAPPQRFSDAATKLIAAINADDQPAIQQMFNETMQKAFPPEKTGPFFQGVLSAKGKMQSAAAPEVSGPTATVRVAAERGDWQFEITLDASDRIAGLRVLPVADEPGRIETAPADEQGAGNEKTYLELRRSKTRSTQLMAERYFSLIRMQEWSDLKGQSKVMARYLAHDPDLKWVKLQAVRGSGASRVVKEIQVPVEKLSKTSQSRVRQIAALQRKLDELAAAEAEQDATGTEGAPLHDPGQPMVDEHGREPRQSRRGRVAVARQQEQNPSISTPQTGDPGPGPAEAFDPDPLGFAEMDLGSQPTGPTASAGLPIPGFAAGPPPRAADSTPADAHHPQSAEQLIAAFTKAFEAGDKRALEKLIYWGNSSDQNRKITRQRLIDDAGRAKIIAVTIKSEQEAVGPTDRRWTVPTKSQFDIEYETGSAGHVFQWPFGVIDGNYYLGAWNAEQPK